MLLTRTLLPKTLLIAAALTAATPALAHPKLVSSTPAANATVVKPTVIKLNFSEKLTAPLSGINLTMTGMPGMASHKPMKITGFKAAVADKTMIITLPRPLPAGSYALSWHVVGGDTHRIQGSFNFTVR